MALILPTFKDLLDFFKIIAQVRNKILVTIIVLLVSYIIIQKTNLLELLKTMSFDETQKSSSGFFHDMQKIMDKYVIEIESILKGEGTCIIEYISMQPVGTAENRYFGYVNATREFDRELKRVIDTREKRLKKTHRDIDYGVQFSKFMDSEKEKYPNGITYEVSKLQVQDDPNHQIMLDTFRRDGTGNFINLKVDYVGASYLINEKKLIIGHPVILCDKIAGEKLGTNLLDITASQHLDFIKYSNSSKFTQSYRQSIIK